MFLIIKQRRKGREKTEGLRRDKKERKERRKGLEYRFGSFCGWSISTKLVRKFKRKTGQTIYLVLTYIIMSVCIILNENFLGLMEVEANYSTLLGHIYRFIFLTPLQSCLNHKLTFHLNFCKQKTCIQQEIQQKFSNWKPTTSIHSTLKRMKKSVTSLSQMEGP